MRKIWVLQFVVNALIVIAFYEWLGIRDSRASQLILSLVLGLAIVAATVFLHSRTFHIKPLRFALVLVLFLLVYWALEQIPIEKIGLWLASTLTHSLRKPVKPEVATSVLRYVLRFLQWVLVPLVLIQRRSPKFWLQYVVVVCLAFVVPSLLVHWTPKLKGTALEVTSFILRFGIAYCLVTTGFAALWRFTSSGNPVESQPSTAVLP